MKIVILNRDGTINALGSDDYVASPDDWVALPGALEAISRLNRAGWHVVVASNQPGLGRGMIDMATFNAIHAKMHRQLAAVGARVEAVFFCPHAPEDACACRKPAPGLFVQIGARFGVPMASVHAAGNAMRHVRAAAAAGCRTHLLMTGKSEHLRGRLGQGSDADLAALAPDVPPGTHAHEDLGAFADWLLAQPTT